MLYKVALSEIILPLDSGGNRSIGLLIIVVMIKHFCTQTGTHD